MKDSTNKYYIEEYKEMHVHVSFKGLQPKYMEMYNIFSKWG